MPSIRSVRNLAPPGRPGGVFSFVARPPPALRRGMSGFLSGLLGRGPPDGPEVRVDRPVCVVGDVHGRLDLLRRMLDRLDAERPEATIVTVGDYIDRGPESRGVLELLAGRGAGTVCLRGNHEDMMLGFLDDPSGEGPRWLINGGVRTLASFGIPGVDAWADAARLEAASRDLRAALGPLEGWMRSLPLWWRSGDLFVSHAGGDPARPPEAQEAGDLLWGHPDFGLRPRTDGLWAAHGHTIVEHPYAARGDIAVDTGAFFTGRLTAAVVAPGAPVGFVRA